MSIKRTAPKKIRLEDLAQVAGVSVSTVSLALRGDMTITQETRDRIVALRDEMGYVPLRATKAVARQARPRILFALLRRSFESDPYNVILDGVLKASRELGAEVALGNELMHELGSKTAAPAGVVLAGDIDERVVLLCRERNIPVVVVGTYFLRYPCSVVQVDIAEHAQLTVERAIAEGAKRFFYACSEDAVFLVKRYLSCLRVVLEGYGYDLPPENVCMGAYGSEALARQMSSRIGSGRGNDAIFTEHLDYGDFCQAVFLQSARKPRIYSLRASDIKGSPRTYPCLNLGLARLGQLAVVRLLDMLEGRNRGQLDPYACVFPSLGWLDGDGN